MFEEELCRVLDQRERDKQVFAFFTDDPAPSLAWYGNLTVNPLWFQLLQLREETGRVLYG